jgi:hypothetical protein
MVQLTGIQIKLQMVLKAKSGFRVRVLMFLTPYHMWQLADCDDDDDLDNIACNLEHGDVMGSFRTNAQWLSAIHKDEEGQVTKTVVCDKQKCLKNKSKLCKICPFTMRS